MGGQAISSFDYLAACLIVIGMVCQLFHRRLPKGLGTSLFVAATTVGIGVAAAGHTWAFARIEYLWLRLTAILCAAWALFGWLSVRGNAGWNQGGRSGNVATQRSSFDPTSPSATFFAWALVMGIGGVVQAFYLIVFNTWTRIVEPETLGEGLLSTSGLWDLGAILLAVLLWRASGRKPAQPAMTLSLASLVIWWTSLTIPASYEVYGEVARSEALTGSLRPNWWDWTFHLQFSLALLLLGAAVIQDFGYRARRIAAWPDRLDDLLAPYSKWPAYIQVESVVAAAILILGVYQLFRHGAASPGRGLASAVSCLMAGTTCMFMTYRRWSGNTTGLGMALLTLGVVILATTVSSFFMSGLDYSASVPILFNAILLAMAVMVAWWSWLGRFWSQQLLDEVPWTTAGRMIPLAKSTAFLIGALSVLVAFKMALWPKGTAIEVEDRSAGRLTSGLLAMFLLIVVFVQQARRDNKPTLAALAMAIFISAGVFIFVRMPSSPLRGWIQQHDSVVLSCLALPVLVIAEALPGTNWRVLAGPLWLLALLVFPFWSMVELRRPPLPADWVQPLVLAVLGALYSFAGSREHRRILLVLGGTLLFASLTSLYRAYF